MGMVLSCVKPGSAEPSNKGMKQTKLVAAPGKRTAVPPRAFRRFAAVRTASQLIPGVRRTNGGRTGFLGPWGSSSRLKRRVTSPARSARAAPPRSSEAITPPSSAVVARQSRCPRERASLRHSRLVGASRMAGQGRLQQSWTSMHHARAAAAAQPLPVAAGAAPRLDPRRCPPPMELVRGSLLEAAWYCPA